VCKAAEVLSELELILFREAEASPRWQIESKSIKSFVGLLPKPDPKMFKRV
jgi:hypothetical protein